MKDAPKYGVSYCNGGGLMIYVREDIPSKTVYVSNDNSFEGIFLEINLRKKKWLLCFSYNPKKILIETHLNNISKVLDANLAKYDQYLLIGDLNSETTEPIMSEFCDTYSLKSLVKEATCFKNPERPTCIDLMLTNSPRSFQNSMVVETGLSDFHKMTVTVLKMFFQKIKPKVIYYRDYKNYSNEVFIEKIVHYLDSMVFGDIDNTFQSFLNACLGALNSQAPIKQKYIRANQAPFMNKELNKAVMDRSRLRNKYLINRTEENKRAYNKQRNYVVSLVRKSKREYYNNLDIKKIIDNKKFWKTVKPLFSDKISRNNKIILIENGNILSEEDAVSETLNNFYSNIITNLNIPEYEDTTTQVNELEDPILKAIEKYKNHPSIRAINTKGPFGTFSFSEINREEVMKEIQSLDTNKASQESDIPIKLIKQNLDLFSVFMHESFNKTMETSKFPSVLKLANITPIFKKGERTDKGNYRPVSILPNLSKIYERCIYKQILSFFDNIFSKYQCGFRKKYGTQHALLLMIEKWRKSLDNGDIFCAVLTDLSKAFDCLPHDLIIAKLKAYGFDEPSLKLMHSYLSGRKQRTKIGNSYSPWEDITHGVPQGSILGPLLFNIFLCDMFFLLHDIEIASYADDTTPYVSANSIEETISILEDISEKLFQWFTSNQMKANEGKCHLLLRKNSSVSIKIKDAKVKNSTCEKLLGIQIDNKHGGKFYELFSNSIQK